jgi:hypothetical protein
MSANEIVEIDFEIPDRFTSSVSARELTREGKIHFNGRTYTMRLFLLACLPLLDDIEANADYIRVEETIQGKRWGVDLE